MKKSFITSRSGRCLNKNPVIILHKAQKINVLFPKCLKTLINNSKANFFCGSFVFFVLCVFHASSSVHCCLVVTCGERADLLALVGDVYCIFVTFPYGILGQVWYLIVLFPDLCRLSYFGR